MSDLQGCSVCGTRVDLPGSCIPCSFSAVLAPAQAPDLKGMRLGPYELGNLLGQGGVGLVYEAVDTRPKSIRFGQKVALKILAADVDNADPLSQLMREAKLAASLEDQHFLPVYEADEHDGMAYFTMKRVDGGPLKTPAATPRGAAELTLKIALAVRFAHRHGILHLDLKPANVLVDTDGRPFVTDFGLAEFGEIADGKVRAGTPQYMAPETWEGKPATTAVDVWGLGTILYQLLTGHPPFAASSLIALQRKTTTETPPALSNVPPDLAAICMRCLEKAPSHRYISAHELASDLTRFLANEPVQARPLGFAARLWRRAARHPIIAVLSVLLVCVVIGLFVAVAWGLRAQRIAYVAADHVAQSTADHIAAAFKHHAHALQTAGRDPRIARAVADPALADEECERLLANHDVETFGTWFIFDKSGVMLGSAPSSPNKNRGRSYHWRDYFLGAEKHAKLGKREPYVSKAYLSEADDHYEMAISYPVFNEANVWVGVLATGIYSGAALGSFKLEESESRLLSLAVLAPRDRDRELHNDRPFPDRIMISHPGLHRGEIRAAGEDDLSRDLDSGTVTRGKPVEGTPLSVLVMVARDNLLFPH